MAAELKLTVTPVADSADLAANTSKVKILLHRTRQGLWDHLQREGLI